MDSVTGMINKSAAVCDTSKGKCKANPLVIGENSGSGNYGMLEGDIIALTIKPAECLSFFPTGGVGGNRSLLIIHELTQS